MWGATVADLISAGGYPPRIANGEATDIGQTDATLNGTLISAGYLPTTVAVFRGPADGGDTTHLWATTNWFAGNPEDAPRFPPTWSAC